MPSTVLDRKVCPECGSKDIQDRGLTTSRPYCFCHTCSGIYRSVPVWSLKLEGGEVIKAREGWLMVVERNLHKPVSHPIKYDLAVARWEKGKGQVSSVFTITRDNASHVIRKEYVDAD